MPERESTASYRYFTEEEFNKLTPSCSLSDMDPDFMRRLDSAREICGFPFVVTSAFRSHSWNVAHGRDYHSLHEDGRAVDLRCVDSKKRAQIVFACMFIGLRGIGVYPTFIHVDLRDDCCLFIGKQ